MQDECVSFGLPGKLINVLPGYGLASKMSDEVGKTQNDGVIVSSELVIVGCKIRERGRNGTCLQQLEDAVTVPGKGCLQLRLIQCQSRILDWRCIMVSKLGGSIDLM